MQGTLRICRSVLQGIKKSLWPLLSGIGELAARSLVCLLIPQLINPSNPTSNASFVGLSFSNSAAWLASVIIMGIATIYHLKKGVLKKETPLETQTEQ